MLLARLDSKDEQGLMSCGGDLTEDGFKILEEPTTLSPIPCRGAGGYIDVDDDLLDHLVVIGDVTVDVVPHLN